VLQVHNRSTVTEPSDGERIALRRNRLGWKQRALADAAGVSLTTVVQIEKDRGVRTESLRAVLAALDAAEKKPAPRVTSPDRPVRDDAASTKEGADAATKLRVADARLERIEVFLVETLEAVRRARADIADDGPQVTRKRG
jgi:transcriptional regulator with XRE-family HTH domain